MIIATNKIDRRESQSIATNKINHVRGNSIATCRRQYYCYNTYRAEGKKKIVRGAITLLREGEYYCYEQNILCRQRAILL